MKLIMPMAGKGSRFAENGYEDPKPMIDVNGIPMFVHAERCIGLDFEQRIFLTRNEHGLHDEIKKWYPESTVIVLDEETEGTACTIMIAKEYFDDGSSIFISNCDQHINWEPSKFTELAKEDNVDGIIMNFHCPERDPKWSFADVDENGNITRVAEKEAISEWATAGYYYWRDGRHFVESVENMIEADDRVNGEFYTCPTYNHTLELEGIGDIRHLEIKEMQGLGTPDDLENFLQNY